jgi:short-subunit dehydrogenase
MVEKHLNNFYTLITGGSAGIGKALAEECAKRGCNLILISLPGEQLVDFSNSLMKAYPIDVKYFEIDLTDIGAPQKVYEWCNQEGFQVNRLINNAGVGYTGLLEISDISLIKKIIDLNISAVTILTRLFIPVLKKYPPAYILNIGSMGSFLPVPYKGVYAASKSFVYSFSMALREELRGTKVRVTILCPGPVPTNEEIKKRIASEKIFTKIALLNPNKVAQRALKGNKRGKSIIIPGIINKIYFILLIIVPRLLRPRVMAWFYKQYNSSTT